MSTINKKVFLCMIVTVVVLGITLQPKKAEEDVIPPPVIKTIPEVPVILKKIAWCESRNHQFNDDGSIYKGEINPLDTGKYQINLYWNGEDSVRLGYDIYTLEGNTDMALYLYKQRGTQPWNWSKDCWGNPNRVWSNNADIYWSK